MGGVPSVEQSFLMSTISWRGEDYDDEDDDSEDDDDYDDDDECCQEEVHILRWRYRGQLHNSRNPRCRLPLPNWSSSSSHR